MFFFQAMCKNFLFLMNLKFCTSTNRVSKGMKYQKNSQELIKADEKTRKGQKEKFGNDIRFVPFPFHGQRT